MSADSWTICPRCRGEKVAALAAEKRRVLESYGHVPAHEYLASVEALRRQGEQAAEESFREDYEIGLSGASADEFYVHYEGRCTVCNLTHTYDWREKVRF